jgi:hypothetical protein
MKLIHFRQTARKLSIRSRHKALTSHEQVRLRKLRLIICALILTVEGEFDEIRRQQIRDIIYLLCSLTISIKADISLPNTRPIRKIVRINNFEDDFIYNNLRFRKEELLDMIVELKIPEYVMLGNRSIMHREEMVIRGLFELTNGTKHVTCMELFGRHSSEQSRAFKFFINYIYDGYHQLVDNNLEWWHMNGFMKGSYDLIQKKIDVASDELFALFIDCNCLETCTPGGGPRCDGISRWDPLIQQSFYNGWKSIHGLKHQTVDNAYGFTVDMLGPESLRRNDLQLLHESDMNNRLHILFTNTGSEQYKMFGDSAYVSDTNISSYKKNVNWNSGMKRVRISIEWNYATTQALFAYVSTKNKLKLMSSDQVSKVYVTATLLKNFHCAFYGNQTLNYFNAELPNGFFHYYVNQLNYQ